LEVSSFVDGIAWPTRRIASATARSPSPGCGQPSSQPEYVYRWNRQGRKGQPCWLTARGALNSIRIEFADGYVMITSGNAIRKINPAIEHGDNG
jgi:hypothetical protein